MKVDGSIIGYGSVGKATAKAFGITKYFDIKGSSATLEGCAQSQFVFICLPTPTNPNTGEQDRESITQIVKQIAQIRKTPMIVIRSTVIPGTADHLRKISGMEIVSNPEFGSEDTMNEDIANPSLVVVGASNKNCAKAVMRLYDGYNCPKLTTDTATAEIIKYSFNAWFATKVTYGNLIYDICERAGGNYEQIRGLWEDHPWFGKNHWNVFHKGYRGFKGGCFPKDTQAFLTYYQNPLLKAVIQMNAENLRK